MQPIPPPQVLDPDRVLDNDRDDLTADHRARAALLDDALRKTCDYAQQLWNTLDEVRGYLMGSLPPDPRSPGAHSQVSASPTGPDDEQGWQEWVAAYASVNSVLCGPHGDSGYGVGEARHAAELRRNAPTLALHAEHPELDSSQPSEASAAAIGNATGAQSRSRARTLATAVLLVLAARGLLLPRKPARAAR
jgi:hypothetical protein